MKDILANKHVRKATSFVKARPVASAFIIAALAGTAWFAYTKAFAAGTETKYVLGTVTKGTVVASVSASGQVSASDQLDLKPQVSGTVVYVGVAPGQKVSAGTLIAELDATEAQKTVRDAQTNLESAQIALEKLQEPASALTMTQAQNALSDAKDSLAQSYASSVTDVTNTFLDLPDIVTNLDGILENDDARKNGQKNEEFYADAIGNYDLRAPVFEATAYNDYVAAKQAYDAAFSEYQALGSSPSNDAVEKALDDSYAAAQLTAKALKSADAFIQLYADTCSARSIAPSPTATAALTNLSAYTTKMNSHLSSLLSDKTALTQGEHDVVEKQQSLDATKAGADALDIQSAQLSVTKAQNALQDAKSALADYYVTAPFSGTIAAVNVKEYDSASSGTAVATLITSQRIAELSLDEVDAAKVHVGDKATLTFDAIDGLSLTGQVAQIDTIGTVSQGVVSYDVKIGFDSQDDRIKPGMTVNAAIITAAHQDVLAVPSSAIKTQNGQSFVSAFVPPINDTGASASQGVASKTAPQQIPVETGISDDTNTEITSGLTEGEQIVVRTVSAAVAQTAAKSSAPSLFGGSGGGMRGGMRVGGGG